MNGKVCIALALLTALASVPARAADKIVLHIGNATISAYRTADLESAKAEAAAAHKPRIYHRW